MGSDGQMVYAALEGTFSQNAMHRSASVGHDCDFVWTKMK